MKICSIIQVLDHADAAELAGAASGAAWFRAVRPWIDSADPGLHGLDFAGVRVATVSWLREGVLALMKYGKAVRDDITIIAANLPELVREELAVALEATSGVMIAAQVTAELEIHAPCVLGRLDPALEQTLRVVQHEREFDAPFVSREVPELALSAANNRLAAIEAKGILRSERRGRGRVYRPVLENLDYGQ
jgi:DNA-binding transcriptional ArsR family regulator